MKQPQNTDIVSGLPYYDDFVAAVEEELREHWNDYSYAMIAIDINNFKYINRIYGFDKANDLLRRIGTTAYGLGDVLVSACRTHSDHAVFLYRVMATREEFILRVEEFTQEFVSHFARQFSSVTLHINNGIYFLTDPNESLNLAMDKANTARRRCKGNFAVYSVIFEEEMLKRKDEDVKVLATFENALKNEHIQVYFQPKVNVMSKTICGAEALSRLYDDEGKLMYPDSYIPVLENSGKIIELDWFVIRRVFADLEGWLKKGYKVVPVSINLSRMHFVYGGIAQRLIHEFSLYQVPTNLVEFEVTESLFYEDEMRIVDEIEQLRAAGFRISMDDFGVGYSTLNSLSSLPVDVIKFDKGFVQHSVTNDAGYQIMSALIQVLRRINFDVVCEGVETQKEEKLVFECGCDTVQGYLYDKPIPEDAFVEKYMK